eukprot:8725230-Alexandrium_andersonii.AAC.1
MSASLVGSEMCIRDSAAAAQQASSEVFSGTEQFKFRTLEAVAHVPNNRSCLLYTSDAADDM